MRLPSLQTLPDGWVTVPLWTEYELHGQDLSQLQEQTSDDYLDVLERKRLHGRQQSC